MNGSHVSLPAMHLGEIVALDTPAGLRAELGDELVELRVDGSGDDALATLQERGMAGTDAFVVGSTLTLPVSANGVDAPAEIRKLDLPVASLTTRRPTLDDVYLRLTGGRLAEAA